MESKHKRRPSKRPKRQFSTTSFRLSENLPLVKGLECRRCYVSGTPPEPRYDQSAAVLNKKIFIFGGYANSGRYNDIRVLDLERMEWRRCYEESSSFSEQLGPAPRSGHASCLVGCQMFIIGGYGIDFSKWKGSLMSGWCKDKFGELKHHSDVNVLEIQDGPLIRVRWLTLDIRGAPPHPRSGHSASNINKKIYVFGGYYYDETRPSSFFNDTYELNLDILEWKPFTVKGNPPHSRRGHSASEVGSKIYIFGGYYNDQYQNTNSYFNDVHVLDTEKREWKKCVIKGKPPNPRYRHTASVISNKIYIYGGSGDFQNVHNYYSDMFILDLDRMEWRQCDITPPALFGHSACVVNGNIYTFGGQYYCQEGSKAKPVVNEVYIFDIVLSIPPVVKEKFDFEPNLSMFLNSPLFSDISWDLPDGTKIYAHKAILTVLCPNLLNMPSSKINSETILNLFHYIYTQTLPASMNLSSIVPLYAASLEYSLNYLTSLCQDFIIRSLTPETVLQILQLSNQYKIAQISEYCLWFINEHKYLIDKIKDGCEDLVTLKMLLGLLTEEPKNPFDQKGCSENSSSESAGVDFGRVLERGFIQLLDEEKTSDVKILLSNCSMPIYAHKIVLASRSDYFRSMFLSDMTESSSGVIDLSKKPSKLDPSPSFRKSIVRPLLRYLYTGELILDKKTTNLSNLLKIAHLFKLEELYIKISDLMSNYISTSNVFYLFSISQTYGLVDLKEKCLRFLTVFPDVCLEDDIMGLSGVCLVDLVRSLVKHQTSD